MKKISRNLPIYFAFFALLLNMPSLLSAQVYAGNLHLQNQADVDNFSYTEITGTLTISGADIENLDGLSGLTSVGGQLEILENPLLNNLDGLSSLISVGGELPPIYGAGFSMVVASNPLLPDLDGLSSLSSLNEISKLWVVNNATLTGFCGLYTALNSGISSLDFELIISGNLADPPKQQIINEGPCIFDPGQLIADLFADGTLNQGQANLLNSKLNTCELNIIDNLVTAWVNAGILAQGQANVLNASATSHCSSAPRLAAQQSFSLGQNYPNPTSMITVIPFTLPTSGRVSIQLYDASGKMVRNLMDQDMTEGRHEVKINLGSVPAGTYFYKLQAGEHIQTLPMIVE